MALIAFNLGMPKSGTSTLQNALMRSGFNSLHWFSSATGLYVGPALYHRYFEGDPIMSDFPDATVVTQADLVTKSTSFWPQMDLGFLRQLRKENPEMQFILPVRDPAMIANSMSRWADMIDRLHTAGAPGLPPRMAKSEARIAHWIEAHFDNCRQMFSDLVEYRIEDPDAPKILEEALGIDLKWWGHSNKNVGQVEHLSARR